MRRQGEKMYKYGTDYILQEACSLSHVAVCRYARLRVVTTTYKTYFVNLPRTQPFWGNKKKKKRTKNIPATYLYNALKRYPTFADSCTYRTSVVKLLIQYRFCYVDYTANVE